MDDKKIDELINKALNEDLSLPEGLSQRLERQIDNLAATPSPTSIRRYSPLWLGGIAATILGAILLLVVETRSPRPELADTYKDPEKAAMVAQNALSLMSANLNKGLGQVNDAGKEVATINKLINKHLNK